MRRRAACVVGGAVLGAAALALGGCRAGESDPAPRDAAVAVEPGAPESDAAAVAAVAAPPTEMTSDAHVLAVLAALCNSHIEADKLALEKASDERVGAAAAAMMRDHAALLERADTVAARLATEPLLPESFPLEVRHASAMEALRAVVPGAAFDSVYVAHTVESHRDGLQLLSQAALAAAHGELRAYIDHVIPVAQRHLARGEELRRALSRS